MAPDQRPNRVAGVLALAWILLIGGVSSATEERATRPEPNILLITVDTLRADYVRTYDRTRGVTRRLDTLASDGVVFTRAFSHVPLTLPSHCSIFTGVPPSKHGVHDNSGYRLGPDWVTLAEWLKARGYATAAFVGAFPLDRRFGLDQGFDTYREGYPSHNPLKTFFPERKAEAVVTDALRWLHKHGGRTPWFLWVHVFDPHQPYLPPEPFAGRFARDPYGGEVAYADDQLGRLLDDLRARNLFDSTLIIVTADHGEALGDHGENTHGLFAYNATLHVPLILHIPGNTKPLRISDYVALSDIFPTVAGFLGESPPPQVTGRNLVPLWRNPKASVPEPPIYIEALAPFLNRGWAPLTGIIWRHRKYLDLPIPEFYNLDQDFAERKNLYSTDRAEPYRRKLARMFHLNMLAPRSPENKETLEALRSLGYAQGETSPAPSKRFTAEDDPKTLLPVHQQFMRALQLYNRSEWRPAIEAMKEVITKRRDMILAYLYLSQFYHDAGDLRRAALALQAALKVNPNHLEVLTKLGITRIEMGDFQPGIDLLQTAVKRKKDDPDLWNYLGIAYWRTGRYEASEKAFFQAMKYDPADPMIQNNLGNLYFTMKKFTQAERAFQKALELDDHLAAAVNGLGACALARGKTGKALEYFRKAVRLDPNYTLALFNLGSELFKAGRKKEALPYLTRYLELAGPSLSPEEFLKISKMIDEARGTT